MTAIPPTTTYEIEQPDESPCCDADLVLVSPPIGYECRECGEYYTLADTDDDSPETCQTIMSSGETCGRELPCPYHS